MVLWIGGLTSIPNRSDLVMDKNQTLDFSLKRDRLYKQVADQIEEWIISDSLRPGDKLPSERELAERTGVSRTVVREAIRTLSVRGLVTVRPGRGTYVQELSLQDATASMETFLKLQQTPGFSQNMHEVRRMIEVEVAGLAAQRATEEDCAAIEAAINDMIASHKDPDEYIRHELTFHSVLASATHNELFGMLLSPIADLLMESTRALLQTSAAVARGIAHHRNILLQIKERNSQQARQAMRVHLEYVQSQIEHKEKHKEKKMNDYANYATRVSEQYKALRSVGQPDASWDDAYNPPYTRRGFAFVKEDVEGFHESISNTRKRVHLKEKLTRLLREQPQAELPWRTPLGEPEPLVESVRREPRIVLLSEAGAGKTTALRYQVAHPPLLEGTALPTGQGEGADAQPLAILIDLPDLAATGISLTEYLSQDAQQRLSLSLAPQFFWDVLFQGHVLLCLDGLDAIVGQQERAKMVRQIEGWVQQFPRCRYIVTARASAYTPSLSQDVFAHHVLLPWSETYDANLETRWNEALDAWTVQDPEQPYYVQRHRLWRSLALRMRAENCRSVPVEQAQQWVAEALQAEEKAGLDETAALDAAESLLRESLPALDLAESDDNQLAFASRLLHDILTARELEAILAEQDVEAAWEVIEPHLWDAGWREAILLVFRFLAQDHPQSWSVLLGRLLEAGESDDLESISHRQLLVAGLALAASQPEKEVEQEVSRQIVDGLFNWLTDAQTAGRQEALTALLHLADRPYVVERACQLLQETSLDEWSSEAAMLLSAELGQAKAGDIVESLLAHLDNTEASERVRQVAAIALGQLGSGGALGPGRQNLLEGKMIVRVYDADQPIDLRAAVVRALGAMATQTHSAATLKLLTDLAQGEKKEKKVPFSLQTTAAKGLCSVMGTMDDPELVEQLWELARDEEVEHTVRCHLLESLGRLDNAKEAAHILIGMSRHAKLRPPGHRSALETLGRLGYADPPIVDKLVEIAATKDRKAKDFVRLAAAHTLGQLGYLDLSIQHLLMLFADKSIYHMTRNQAFERLGELGLSGDDALDEAMTSIVRVWAHEENTTENVREHAIRALCILDVNRAAIVEDLITIIQDRETYARVRRYAAETLADLPIEEEGSVREALEGVFYNPEETSDLLRIALANVLLGLERDARDENALAYLRAAARSEMAQVRYKAALVLMAHGEDELVTLTLIELAQGNAISDVIRRDALRTLELYRVGDEQVVQGILPIWQEEDLLPNVRESAYSALKTVTTD